VAVLWLMTDALARSVDKHHRRRHSIANDNPNRGDTLTTAAMPRLSRKSFAPSPHKTPIKCAVSTPPCAVL
jgi:hypothetical protein